MSNDVVPNSPNTLTVLPIRLVAMKFAAWPIPKPKQDPANNAGKSAADELLDGFSLEVLANAYVILIQTGDALQSLGGGVQPMYARTAANGTLRRINREEADGAVPDESKTICFDPGARFACFWTRNKAVFKATAEAVEQDPAGLLGSHPFFQFQLTPHRHANRYSPLAHGNQDLGALQKAEMSAASRAKLELLLYDQDGDYSKQLVHGVLRGFELSSFNIPGLDSKASYVVARSDALAAMFVAELVDRQAVAERAKTWEDWQFLHGALNAAEQAVNFGSIPELEQKLNTMQYNGQTYNVDPKLVQNSSVYLKYVYDCAAAGVRRGLVCDAIRWPTNDTWKDAANEIRDRHGIQHPNFGQQYYILPYTQGVQNYYDFYEWGFRQKKKPWPEKVTQISEKIDSEVDALRKRLASFIDRRAPYPRLLTELASHIPDADNTCRKALHRNYLDLSLFNRYDWWAQLEKLENEHAWAQFKQYAGWIGSLSDKLGELFGEFFGDPLVAIAFNEALEENASRFEKLFANMTNFDKRFGGKLKTRAHPDGTTFVADFKTNTVVVKKAGQVEETIQGFKFLVTSEERTVQVQQVVPGRRGNAWKKRVRTVSKTETIHNVEVTTSFKGVHRWPAFMAAFGDTIAFVFTMSELYGAVKRERADLEMVGKVGRDTFQAVSSVGTALNVIKWLPQKAWLLKSVRVAGPVGAVLEAVFNVKEGLTILFDENSPALQTSDSVVATLYYTKGWVLLGSVAGGATVGTVGAVSALMAGGTLAAASAAFFTPLGIALAVGAVVVVGIEVIIFTHNGPSSSMEGYDDKLTEVVEDEFDDEKIVSRTLHNFANYSRDANRVLATLES